ncbi:ParA family protein [candidate division KSB1 bacterium]|nr:ParA family protein [candidate division KSB1 bacterium]
MKIIALYSIKGGVGKTAAAVNLAFLAAQEAAQTLLIDLDPQGAASYYFRIKPSKKLKTKTLLKGSTSIDQNIKATDFEHLDLLPSDMTFRNLDLALNRMNHSKKILNKLFKPFQNTYEFIFLDAPPNLTLVSENIFNAADVLLVPVKPSTLSVNSFGRLQEFIAAKKRDRLKVLPFFSMVEARKKFHREVMQMLTMQAPEFLKQAIPYSVDVENMGIHREPITCFRPSSPAAKAFSALWREIKMVA